MVGDVLVIIEHLAQLWGGLANQIVSIVEFMIVVLALAIIKSQILWVWIDC